LSEDVFIDRLLAREEAAFRELVERYHSMMLAFARSFLRNPAAAEEVVQETWLVVVQSLPKFQRRSSLKSWIYAILANRARSHAARLGRTVNFSDLTPDGSSVLGPEAFAANGHWAGSIEPWDEMTPERLVSGGQLWSKARAVIEALPEGQRAVLILRDVEGEDGPSVAAILGISEANQRVLLHRARSKIRAELDPLMRDT
jgi:RNA polymerase sigma-70 factor, ECF subfamily